MINIAVEDQISSAVVEKMLAYTGKPYSINAKYMRSSSDLKRSLKGFNHASRVIPHLVLTDLDNKPCPLTLKNEWLSTPQSPNLIFRIAVREVEAWLLADRKNLSSFLGVSKDVIPQDPELLEDPKRKLVEIAGRSNFRKIREGIGRRETSTAKVGLQYNALLVSFVIISWDLCVARANAPSLDRMLKALQKFQYITH